MTLARAVPEAPAFLSQESQSKTGRIESGPFELRTLKTGQLFEREVALHMLCMNMTCIPKRLKFMADPREL
jgi:hypothetical protein